MISSGRCAPLRHSGRSIPARLRHSVPSCLISLTHTLTLVGCSDFTPISHLIGHGTLAPEAPLQLLLNGELHSLIICSNTSLNFSRFYFKHSFGELLHRLHRSNHRISHIPSSIKHCSFLSNSSRQTVPLAPRLLRLAVFHVFGCNDKPHSVATRNQRPAQ